MHTYATDSDRGRVTIILAFVAIVVTFGVNALVQKWSIQFPWWWFDSPSVMLFYGILYQLYNRVLWRLHIPVLDLPTIPDYNGVWAGVLTSSHKDATGSDTKIDIVFYIKQTWSEISIRTETVTSTSYTTMAAIYTKSYEPGLRYEYESKPGAFATTTMHTHPGTGYVRLSPDGKKLTGEYYTGRDRVTFGTFALQFVSKEELSREEALKRLRQQSGGI
jgi:hypothetical protein